MRRAYQRSRRARVGLISLGTLLMIYTGISNHSGTNNPFKWKEYSVNKIEHENNVNHLYDSLLNRMDIDTSLIKILNENTLLEEKERMLENFKPSN